MKTINKYSQDIRMSLGMSLLALTMWVGAGSTANADSLYIGDYYDNTVKQFDADTGDFQGKFVKSQGGVHFPNGIVFDSAKNLLLSNQNGHTGTAGEILQYSSTGKLLNQIVKNKDPNAPWAPQGIILVNGVLFVADLQSAPTKANSLPPGTLRRYNSAGVFLGASVPDPITFLTAFHPRGIVLGPDGLVYVSNVPVLGGLGGQVLRFETNGTFVDEFISSPGGVGALNRPSGLVFGPDNRLYVTSFRADATDNDKILIYSGATQVAHLRASAALRPGWVPFRSDQHYRRGAQLQRGN
jgi:sugar lactone lactonase YvrE